MAGRILFVFSMLFFLLPFPLRADDAQAEKATWLRVDIGIIGVASEDILQDALRTAEKNHYQGIIIALDTPGGALESTRGMVKSILSAPLPIVVWVGPAGAHAGSAGAFITVAGHIAAMAPGTNIGAAHPVESTGEDINPESDMRTKVENDTAAFMESLAKLRGRNAQMAVSFVLNSISITAEDALNAKVIDLLSPDPQNLLEAIDGRTVALENGKTMTIASRSANLVTFERSFRQDILDILSNPELFYLLFIAGLIGIAVELTHPGVFFPGVMGAICLILALIASSLVPINFGAALLILLSVSLMVAEIFIPSFGVLGIGGLIGFVAGSLLLIDSKSSFGLSLSVLTVLPAALVLASILGGLAFLVWRNQRFRVQSGSEALLGKIGQAIAATEDGRGQMRLEGEIWKFEEINYQPIGQGESLEVVERLGLLLKVRSLRR